MPKKRQSEQHGPLDECAYEEWAPGGKGGPLRIVMGPNVLARVEPADGENNNYELVDHVDGTLELLRDEQDRLRDCFVTYTTAQQQEHRVYVALHKAQPDVEGGYLRFQGRALDRQERPIEVDFVLAAEDPMADAATLADQAGWSWAKAQTPPFEHVLFCGNVPAGYVLAPAP